MRNFVLIFFLFTTLFAIQSVRAESTHDMCGMNVTKEPSGATIVICPSCKTNESYALAGAAAIKNSDLNDILVQSLDGKIEFNVTLSPAYNNASATVSASVGVASGSFTNNVVDHSATTVAADATRGYAPGGAWMPRSISNRSIARTCTNLVRNTEAIERSIRNTESLQQQLELLRFRGVEISNGGRYRPWDDCSNCRAEEE